MSPLDARQPSALRSWWGVAVITASLFTFLTTELMPVGLLTPISASLGVTEGAAGLLVTLYGISAGLGVPFIVAWTRHVDRRRLLSALLGVLTLGNLLTGLAPGFALVLLTRLVMGFANGVFWAIGVSMAMRLVPERQASRAAAVALSGISIATVAGIPLGTYLTGLTGWRTTFLIWSCLSAVVCAAVAMSLPSLPSDNAVPVREVFALPRDNARMRAVLYAVVLFVLGHFAAYTFIRPYAEDHASASAGFVSLLLVLYGVGGTAGNFTAGYAVRRNPRATFVTACAGILASLLLLLSAGHTRPGLLAVVVLWGLSFGAANLCQVNLMLAAAPDTFEAAMSVNTLGYNTSIALGALFGGLLVNGFGVTGAVWLGAALTAASLAVTLATGDRPTRARAARPAGGSGPGVRRPGRSAPSPRGSSARRSRT